MRLDTAFSPGAARRIGASAALLRVPLRPDIPAQAERAVRIAALAALACHEEGLPLVLRLVIPRAPGRDDGGRIALAPAAARLAHDACADLLVLPLAAALGRARPLGLRARQASAATISQRELTMAADLGACWLRPRPTALRGRRRSVAPGRRGAARSRPARARRGVRDAPRCLTRRAAPKPRTAPPGRRPSSGRLSIDQAGSSRSSCSSRSAASWPSVSTSICRTRSRVRRSSLAISSSVRGSRPSRP